MPPGAPAGELGALVAAVLQAWAAAELAVPGAAVLQAWAPAELAALDETEPPSELAVLVELAAPGASPVLERVPGGELPFLAQEWLADSRELAGPPHAGLPDAGLPDVGLAAALPDG